MQFSVRTWPGWYSLIGGAGAAGLSMKKPMPPWSWLPSGFAPGNGRLSSSCECCRKLQKMPRIQVNAHEHPALCTPCFAT